MIHGSLVIESYNQMMGSHTLSPRERLVFLTLLILFDTAKQAPIPRRELVTATGIANNHLSEVLTALKEKGLITFAKGLLPFQPQASAAYVQLCALEDAIRTSTTTPTACTPTAAASPPPKKRQPRRVREAFEAIASERDIALTEEWFESFWSLYPKRIAKERCKRSFFNIVLCKKVSPEAIIEGLQRALRYSFCHADSKRYIPNPYNWLEGERWEDEVEGSFR